MTDHAREVRYGLTDPAKLCAGLMLLDGAKRQSGGLVIRCPVHGERNPSCSVTVGKDGTIRVRCFACDFTGDALTLIAVVRGANLRDRDGFREVLAEGAEIAGLLTLEAEIWDGRARPERQRVAPPPAGKETEYPAIAEVLDVWNRGKRPDEDPEVSGYLVRRRLDPVVLSDRRLGRVLVPPAPPWARFRGRSWAETGHRLLTRTYDASGAPRGVRAALVRAPDGDVPKRLPPAGKKAAELVLANEAAYRMLHGASPARVVIVEGEPDFWTHGCLQPEDVAVIGVTSGSWTDRFAAALPRGAQVEIRTHDDEQGERYAAKIAESIGEKCQVWRAA